MEDYCCAPAILLRGSQYVSTPHISKEDLFYTSGHLPYYADGMFPAMELDNGNYRLEGYELPHA